MTAVGHTGGVVVAAVGARTPVGSTADASAAAWRAGICRVAEHPRFVDATGEPMRVAMDDTIALDAPLSERVDTLALSALAEVAEAFAGASRPAADVLVAVPPARAGWSAADGSVLLQRIATAAQVFVDVRTSLPFTHGHAAGLAALHEATRRIEQGTSQLCLVGGVDSWIDAPALEALDGSGRLASADHPMGFRPGEAAAFVLVASVAATRTLRLPELARVRGVAIAREPHPRGSGTPCVGEGLTLAVRGATAGLGLPAERVTTAYGDLNGERHRSDELMYLPLRVAAPFEDPSRFETTADAWGDVGAATGPLLVAVAAVSGRRRWARGRSVLVFAGSDGGERAAASLLLDPGASA